MNSYSGNRGVARHWEIRSSCRYKRVLGGRPGRGRDGEYIRCSLDDMTWEVGERGAAWGLKLEEYSRYRLLNDFIWFLTCNGRLCMYVGDLMS